MIYIFNGFRYVFSLPSLLCQGIGQLCKMINCQPLQEFCSNVAGNCKAFTGRPLSSLVILIYVVSLAEIYMCYMAGLDEEHKCEFTDDAFVTITAWSGGQAVLAALGLVFAPYFQHRVWTTVMETYEEDKNAYDTDKQGRKMIPRLVVQESFKREFLYDFGVLVYFIAQVVHAYWSMKGKEWIKNAHMSELATGGASTVPDAMHATAPLAECELDGAEGYASEMGMISCFATFAYALTWYCCSCCAGTVTMTREEEAYAGIDQDEVEGVPGGDIMYAQAMQGRP